MSSKQLSHNGENPEENSVKNPAEKSVNGPASAFNAAENAKIKAATNKNEDEFSEPASSVLQRLLAVGVGGRHAGDTGGHLRWTPA